MSAPKRIQRKRTKGWRMPEGAVYVGRPSVWGNSWRPEDAPEWLTGIERARWAVNKYRAEAEDFGWVGYDPVIYTAEAGAVSLADIPARLGGRDLVCWCPLDQPCHADVLLEIANG